jgi:S-adenosylmethionine:tRNA ribosyltransferase-isomerase
MMIKSKRPRPGVVLEPLDAGGRKTGTRLRLIERASADVGRETDDAAVHGGAWICIIEGEGAGQPAPIVLARIGLTPIPPYIQAARRRAAAHAGSVASDEETEWADRADYQTTYAGGADRAGSVAAPTAGLHFTPALLDALAARGIARADVVLHVGTGTFKAVEVEDVEHHPMHAEWCEISPATASAIMATRARGGRVVAVGTTAARTLESFGPASSLLASGASGWTRLLITPGHAWQNVDGLLTNFHLPRTTLLALVAALLPGGAAALRGHYAHAVSQRYRFYSFGDAMMVM